MGIIFDIQRMSVHDGPGIRTTVFFKGCPLSCKWCHNPEGYSKGIQLQYLSKKCINCGECIDICPEHAHSIVDNMHEVDFSKCKLHGKCIPICPSKALSFFGVNKTPKEIIDVVLKDKVFYEESGGGVTFSGGEVLYQSDFLLELVKLAKKNSLSVAIDTSGYSSWKNIERILPYSDIFLYDIKAYSDDIHIKGTNVSNKIILANLDRLVKTSKKIYIRTPLIKEFNANINEVTKMADFLQGKNIVGVTLMPYHILGRSKRTQIGINEGESFSPPSKNELETYKNIYRSRGIKII